MSAKIFSWPRNKSRIYTMAETFVTIYKGHGLTQAHQWASISVPKPLAAQVNHEINELMQKEKEKNNG